MPDHGMEDLLSREILRGQRLRASILAGVFGVGAALLLVLGGLLPEREVLPRLVPLLPGLLAVHQLALRWYIERRLGADGRVRPGFWYLNGLAEISSVTLIVLAVSPRLENPVNALVAPPTYLYFAFIILSTLRLDFWTSVFTGAMAGVQLLGSYFLLSRVASGASVEPLLDSPPPYLMKGFFLLGAGLAAGFVARELRQRIFGSVVAAAERERAEESARAKTAFLANMSHEIRTPLNAIVGYAELLEKDGGLDADHRHAVATMKSSGDHLLGVINQVLDLSRMEAGREELVASDFELGDLAAELTAMFELRCRRGGLSWRAAVEPPMAWVRGDAVRLRQVLINLIGNAIRFTDSGEVELAVRQVSDPGESGESAVRVFRFEVRDTGPGIPRAEQSLVFEPFRTDDRGFSGRGSGLGLAIAHAQVALMGGRLELDSTPGAGSRFSFTLELEAGDPDSAAAVTRADVVGLDGGVAAVVADPSPVSRELLARMLRRVGVDVRESESAAEALAAVADGAPDIVFLDPALAGAGPHELVAVVRGRAQRPRIVAVSSSVLAHERRAILDAGFDAFLGRPVETGRLYDCLAELPGVVLERRAAAPAPADVVEAAARAVALPAEIWASLRGAAEDYNVTDLRKQLARLDELGEDARPLAEQLRRLTRTYDLEAIRAVLDGVPHG